jgi:hypothetical protein
MIETLTKDERLALQLWFRQAMAKLETEEATERFIQNRRILEGRTDLHRTPVSRRRSRRSTVAAHAKELVT